MELFGISDLHLSLSGQKPMHIFGDNWQDHAVRMARAWDATVGDGDVVLCPGDLSWAMRLDEAQADLGWLGSRPGRKVLCRGNHDYWWSTISKVRAALPPNSVALQNDAVRCGEMVIAGSRLWSLPGSCEFGPDDDKIFKRELGRLELSLEAAAKLAQGGSPIIAAVHFPPATADGVATAYTELLERYGVRLCVYGHLHGAPAHRTAIEGEHRGVRYALVACDFIGFAPRRLTGLL
ncbi:MAG: metallophosphoesterase [Deltaproteobacteria bacterium]|nr:metallophosphoesterase [Deltaproteobacteria bacterium]